MVTQYHDKHYDLDLQKIMKYALDYNGITSFFESFIHYFWRHIIINFVHFNSKGMYIVTVCRDRFVFMQKFYKIWMFIVIYYLMQSSCSLLILLFKVRLWKVEIGGQSLNWDLKNVHIICYSCKGIGFLRLLSDKYSQHEYQRVIPRNFFALEDFIAKFAIWMFKLSLVVKSILQLSWFAFILLLANHINIHS